MLRPAVVPDPVLPHGSRAALVVMLGFLLTCPGEQVAAAERLPTGERFRTVD